MRSMSGTDDQVIGERVHILSDGLGYLIEAQKRVSGKLGPQALEPTPENIRTYALALHQEVDELINELNWKPWKAAKPIDHQKAAAEFADILAFVGLFGVYLEAVGIDRATLAAAYAEKSWLNIARLTGQVEGYGKG